MKKIHYYIIALCLCFNCIAQEPTTFSEEALNDTFITLEAENILFKDILEKYKGSTLVIDIWASWCSDCIKGMPKVKKLQSEYNDATYIFLSLDKTQEAWKRGIKKYDVVGEHFFMQSGWKGPFGTFVNLDWIPRYMVVDAQGNIILYKSIKANDKKILNIL